MKFTLDANVLVASAREGEIHHAASRRFLREAVDRSGEFICPILVLPECGAAVARATGESAQAEKFLRDVQGLPALGLVTLDMRLAGRGAEIAIAHRLRGSDALYVTVAEVFAATLITWDAEMLERAPAIVPTMTPADWLVRQQEHP